MRLTSENVERQIFEMWDAIGQMPYNKDRDLAIIQAVRAETNLREKLKQQDLLLDYAPKLLEIATKLVNKLPKYDNDGSFHKEYRELKELVDILNTSDAAKK